MKRKYDKNLSSVIKNVHKAYNKLILNNVHEHVLYVSFLLLLKIEPTYRSSIQVCCHTILIYGYRYVYPKLSDFIILVYRFVLKKKTKFENHLKFQLIQQRSYLRNVQQNKPSISLNIIYYFSFLYFNAVVRSKHFYYLRVGIHFCILYIQR